MKKHWVFTVVWVLFVIFINANAISYYKEYIGVPSISALAEYWWVEDIFLVLVGICYFILKTNENVKNKCKIICDKVLPSDLKHFFSLKKDKVLFAFILILITFFMGAFLTLIKSSSFETALSVAFYVLSPEYTVSEIFFYDWMDTGFALGTLGFTAIKWFFLYILAAIWFRRKMRLTPSAEDSSHE